MTGRLNRNNMIKLHKRTEANSLSVAICLLLLLVLLSLSTYCESRRAQNYRARFFPAEEDEDNEEPSTRSQVGELQGISGVSRYRGFCARSSRRGSNGVSRRFSNEVHVNGATVKWTSDSQPRCQPLLCNPPCKEGEFCVVHLKNGAWQSRCICKFGCGLFPGPLVCGSDGNTYQSPCHIEIFNCNDKTDIKVASIGACNLGGPGARITSTTVRPPVKSTKPARGGKSTTTSRSRRSSTTPEPPEDPTSEPEDPSSPPNIPYPPPPPPPTEPPIFN